MAAPALVSATGAPPINITVDFPEKLNCLLGEKARYKVFHGGRGGSKSWGIARAILIRGIKEPGLRVLCAREVQSSMKESVHQLLKDQIKALKMDALYKVFEDEIRGPGGTTIRFKGLTDPEALKSAESIDILWIEEARIVTKGSWDTVIPTIRKKGSEIWCSFNPKLATDYLYRMFVSDSKKELHRPPNSIVVEINYWDNRWFKDTELVADMEHDKATDPDKWLHVWCGGLEIALEGAVYANELRKATKDGRIGHRVPFISGRALHIFCDLGRGDQTALWFVQIIGLEYRIVRYYANAGHHISHYIEHVQDLVREERYQIGIWWLPHDADHELLASKRTIRQQVSDAGFTVKMVPHLGAGAVHEGIEAARAMFTYCFFDEQNAGDGVNALRSYHYEVKDDGSRSKNPVHDWSSNGADGFRYMGVALKGDTPKPKPAKQSRSRTASGQSWMGV